MKESTGTVMNENAAILAYIGTYTEGESEGIYVLRMNPASGELSYTGSAAAGENPTYLAIDPGRRYLYAANTIDGEGKVSAYEIDSRTGLPRYLNEQPSGGSKPVHLVVGGDGRYVLAANFGSGSVCVHPVREDGSLGAMTDFKQHEGSSVHPTRQQGPRVHSITLDGGGRFAAAAEYGADQVILYGLDPANGSLQFRSSVPLEAGSGPRHFAFHPRHPWAYVINELGNTITGYDYDPAEGRLVPKETVSTLPEHYRGVSHCADVQVNAEGTFLYGSNRGHDSIVVYAINQTDGRLEYRGHEPSLGKAPRSFAIDPTGNFLLAAHQDSGNIVVFRIDRKSGRLHPTGYQIEVPMPVCVKMMVLPPQHERA
ncbi:lactonase family protein [Paenibacillus humicola]|uniref:lactonase family protein n=1 Tax=Paenibacillus humicola TaxID=3110540 RepID=UPI00237AF6E3|nr:lactonase family protein [Paenibacillus humicola]